MDGSSVNIAAIFGQADAFARLQKIIDETVQLSRDAEKYLLLDRAAKERNVGSVLFLAAQIKYMSLNDLLADARKNAPEKIIQILTAYTLGPEERPAAIRQINLSNRQHMHTISASRLKRRDEVADQNAYLSIFDELLAQSISFGVRKTHYQADIAGDPFENINFLLAHISLAERTKSVMRRRVGQAIAFVNCARTDQTEEHQKAIATLDDMRKTQTAEERSKLLTTVREYEQAGAEKIRTLHAIARTAFRDILARLDGRDDDIPKRVSEMPRRVIKAIKSRDFELIDLTRRLYQQSTGANKEPSRAAVAMACPPAKVAELAA